jgi:hypothetical protein
VSVPLILGLFKTGDGALKEAIDAINNLEETAQYIQNNTNKLFDVIVDDVTYTVKDGSLKFMAGVMCNEGFVPYGGFCGNTSIIKMHQITYFA